MHWNERQHTQHCLLHSVSHFQYNQSILTIDFSSFSGVVCIGIKIKSNAIAFATISTQFDVWYLVLCVALFLCSFFLFRMHSIACYNMRMMPKMKKEKKINNIIELCAASVKESIEHSIKLITIHWICITRSLCTYWKPIVCFVCRLLNELKNS